MFTQTVERLPQHFSTFTQTVERLPHHFSMFTQTVERFPQHFSMFTQTGPSLGQDAGGGSRTRDRRVLADLRADSLISMPPTYRNAA
ncbi:hypothetical protein PoB_006040700 [Plakobranchus ocellatus]|uniref:Uncharacterized protein n=1 Tax=Plakobranchus ocellatus TaxID=259542 RepID=A0AAV4CPS9_9GAST|nr:hypothetical protein PoB_006040700 [Plakobranchus ocellatus]